MADITQTFLLSGFEQFDHDILCGALFMSLMLGFVEFLHLDFFFQFWLEKPHPSPTPHHPYLLGTLQISARSWHSPTSEAGGQSLRLTLCDMTAIVY